MAIVKLTCPKCGGNLSFENNRQFGFCEYCGTKIAIQKEVINIEVKSDKSATLKKLATLADQYIAVGDLKSAVDIAKKMNDLDSTNSKAYHILAIAAASNVNNVEESRKKYFIDSSRTFYRAYQKYSGDNTSFDRFLSDLVPNSGAKPNEITKLEVTIHSYLDKNDFDGACSEIRAFKVKNAENATIMDQLLPLIDKIENKMKKTLNTRLTDFSEICQYMVRNLRCFIDNLLPTTMVHWYISQMFPVIKHEILGYDRMTAFRFVCLRLGVYDVGEVMNKLDSSFLKDDELEVAAYYIGSEYDLYNWDPVHSMGPGMVWEYYGDLAPSEDDIRSMSLEDPNFDLSYPYKLLFETLGESLLDNKLLLSLTTRGGLIRMFSIEFILEQEQYNPNFCSYMADAARLYISLSKGERRARLKLADDIRSGRSPYDVYRENNMLRYSSEEVMERAFSLSRQFFDRGKMYSAMLWAEIAFFEKDNSDYHYLVAEIYRATHPDISLKHLNLANSIDYNYGCYTPDFYESTKLYVVAFKVINSKITKLNVTVSGVDAFGKEIEKIRVTETNHAVSFELKRGEYDACFEYRYKLFLSVFDVKKTLHFSVPGQSLSYTLDAGQDHFPILRPQ